MPLEKYTPEEAARSIAESRETLARTAHIGGPREERQEGEQPEARPPVVDDAPTETRNQRDAREFDERDAQWARQRRRERREEHDKVAAFEARIPTLEHGRYEDCTDVAKLWDSFKELLSRTKEIRDVIFDLQTAVDAPAKVADQHVRETLARIESIIGDLGGRSRESLDLPNPLTRVN
jgi:hypothetical protein